MFVWSCTERPPPSLSGDTLSEEFQASVARGVARDDIGAEDEHDPSTVPWNATKEAFTSAVEQAALHAATLCIFGHDWDPVYLLSAELAE
jgi:hypothetical protein